MQIYLVGGAVRDQLLGLSVHERDVEALVADRVWQELDRALAEPDPHIFIYKKLQSHE